MPAQYLQGDLARRLEVHGEVDLAHAPSRMPAVDPESSCDDRPAVHLTDRTSRATRVSIEVGKAESESEPHPEVGVPMRHRVGSIIPAMADRPMGSDAGLPPQ